MKKKKLTEDEILAKVDEKLPRVFAFAFIHTLTFPEVAASKIAVGDIHGELLGGPDRKLWTAAQVDTLWIEWQEAIKEVSEAPGVIPPHVMQYFQETKQFNKAPAEVVKMLGIAVPDSGKIAVYAGERPEKPTDPPKGQPILELGIPFPTPRPKFSWSFTGLDVFFNICPRKFAARWFYKSEIFEDSEASRWGNRKHKADELALLEVSQVIEKGVIIPLERDIVDWPYVNTFLAMKRAGAKLLVEEEIAINRKLSRVTWFDKEAWGRAKIDVGIIKGDTIYIYDWKTGKEKFDEWQLRIFCLFAALAFPHVQHFEARFIWLQEDKISDAVVLSRSEILPVLRDTLNKVARMEEAWAAEIFQCRKNGLCKRYCGVQDCPHWGGK